MTFEKMDMARLEDYAELFISVFNLPPWNDGWTLDNARLSLGELMSTGTFTGFAAVENGRISGKFQVKGNTILTDCIFCSKNSV